MIVFCSFIPLCLRTGVGLLVIMFGSFILFHQKNSFLMGVKKIDSAKIVKVRWQLIT